MRFGLAFAGRARSGSNDAFDDARSILVSRARSDGFYPAGGLTRPARLLEIGMRWGRGSRLLLLDEVVAAGLTELEVEAAAR